MSLGQIFGSVQGFYLTWEYDLTPEIQKKNPHTKLTPMIFTEGFNFLKMRSISNEN